MKIAIIGAMNEEITFLLSQLPFVNSKPIQGFTFYEGKLGQNDIVIVESGIGKVMSGMLMATLINHFPSITKIINVGVAGGIGQLQIGDIVIGEQYVYGDVDITGAGNYSYGQMAKCPRYFVGDQNLLQTCKTIGGLFGTICTNDRFVSNLEELEVLMETHFQDLSILCFDMESAAFAQSCYIYQLDFIAIRAISDVIGSNNPLDTFEHNLERACISSNLYLLKLLKKI